MRNEIKPARYDVKLRIQLLRGTVRAFLFVEALYWNRVLGAQALRLRRAARLRVQSFGATVFAWLLVQTLNFDRFLGIQALRLRRALWLEIKQAYQSLGLRVVLLGGVVLALVFAETLYLGHAAVPVQTSPLATRVKTEFDFTKSHTHAPKSTLSPHA